jgi:hypothetical protein
LAHGFAGGLLGLVAAFLLDQAQSERGLREPVGRLGGQVLPEFFFGQFVSALFLQEEGALKLRRLVHESGCAAGVGFRS